MNQCHALKNGGTLTAGLVLPGGEYRGRDGKCTVAPSDLDSDIGETTDSRAGHPGPTRRGGLVFTATHGDTPWTTWKLPRLPNDVTREATRTPTRKPQ